MNTIKTDDFTMYLIERNVENLSFDLEEEVIAKGEEAAYSRAEHELYKREAYITK